MDYSQFEFYEDIPREYKHGGIHAPSIRFGANAHYRQLREDYIRRRRQRADEQDFWEEAAKAASLAELRYLRSKRPGHYNWVGNEWVYDESQDIKKEQKFWEAADLVARRLERDWVEYRPNQHWDAATQRRRKAEDLRRIWLRNHVLNREREEKRRVAWERAKNRAMALRNKTLTMKGLYFNKNKL